MKSPVALFIIMPLALILSTQQVQATTEFCDLSANIQLLGSAGAFCTSDGDTFKCPNFIKTVLNKPNFLKWVADEHGLPPFPSGAKIRIGLVTNPAVPWDPLAALPVSSPAPSAHDPFAGVPVPCPHASKIVDNTGAELDDISDLVCGTIFLSPEIWQGTFKSSTCQESGKQVAPFIMTIRGPNTKTDITLRGVARETFTATAADNLGNQKLKGTIQVHVSGEGVYGEDNFGFGDNNPVVAEGVLSCIGAETDAC